jgi:hypothetical protein
VLERRFSANLRRHYKELKDFPVGSLVSGDTLGSFNPIYGQGMTVAARERWHCAIVSRQAKERQPLVSSRPQAV